MAIKQTGTNWNPAFVATKRKFIMDSEADVANLPKCCTGSMAISVDGGVIYMVNASGSWVRMGNATFTVAEEVVF